MRVSGLDGARGEVGGGVRELDDAYLNLSVPPSPFCSDSTDYKRDVETHLNLPEVWRGQFPNSPLPACSFTCSLTFQRSPEMNFKFRNQLACKTFVNESFNTEYFLFP